MIVVDLFIGVYNKTNFDIFLYVINFILMLYVQHVGRFIVVRIDVVV